MTNLFNVLLTAGESYTCGKNDQFVFDGILPNIVSTVILIIQIAIPVILIIFGMIDLGKAVMSQKDDEIKKGQQTFFKRLLAAAIVFFIIAVVKLVVGVIAGAGGDSSISCIDCFTKANDNSCRAATYQEKTDE